MELLMEKVSIPEAQAEKTNFLSRCQETAHRHFGISHLRVAQTDVLNAIWDSNKVLATLPTGAGKTLLYVLPSLVMPGTVLVVSPLIALMRDQHRRLEAAGVPSLIFTSDQSVEERKKSFSVLLSGNAKLIFASPERLVLPSFQKVLPQLQVSMLVVDEAHCIVAWGSSFRPEYSRLAEVISKVSPHRVLALTATASSGSRNIIKTSLFGTENVKELVGSPIRSNIFVEVDRCFSETEKWTRLTELIKTTDFTKAIIYFPKRQLCESAVSTLRKLGLGAVAYHAGMTKEQRMSAEIYIHKTTQKVVVCATQAFGMGIDLPNVTLVVVYGYPGNIEEYFQMIGRAGRSGEPARSVLLWTGADPKRRHYQFLKAFPSESEVRVKLARLERFLPAAGSTRFVKTDTLKQILGEEDAKLEGLLTALRLMGLLGRFDGFGEFISLRFVNGQHLSSLLHDLPVTTTRRSLMLYALASFFEKDWRLSSSAEGVLPVKTLIEESGLPWRHCEEVLNHYKNKGALDFEMISAEQMGNGHVLHGVLSSTRSLFARYSATRKVLLESLRQLEVLSEAARCRLERSEAFFGKTLGGVTSHRCGHCDWCVRTSDGGGKEADLFKKFGRQHNSKV